MQRLNMVPLTNAEALAMCKGFEHRNPVLKGSSCSVWNDRAQRSEMTFGEIVYPGGAIYQGFDVWVEGHEPQDPPSGTLISTRRYLTHEECPDFMFGYREGARDAQYGNREDACLGDDAEYRRGYGVGYAVVEALPACSLCGCRYRPATGEVVGYQELGRDGLCGACEVSAEVEGGEVG